MKIEKIEFRQHFSKITLLLSTSIFDTIDSFAALLAEQPEARGVVEELLTAPPLDVYGLLSSQTAEELVELLSRIWFERHRVEEVS